jgi:acyl-CoA thioester hydrolase
MNETTKPVCHDLTLRVRYGETDQLGTYYNSRALEWFECARTELMRSTGLAYTEWEKRGIFLPVVESHVFYRGRARYDDLLNLHTEMSMEGRATLRFDVRISLAETGKIVADGYTLHALIDASGKPVRPPQWLRQMMATPTSC